MNWLSQFLTSSIGRKLVMYLMDRALKIGLDRVFLLTTQTSEWFAELGFVKGDLGDLLCGDLADRGRSPRTRRARLSL